MIKLNIDRIVLDGFNMSQARAQNIKLLMQAELQRRLSQNHTLHDVRDKQISNINMAIEQIDDLKSDSRIVSSITDSIMNSINSKPTK